ncbi:flavin reductase family protein [Streptomyces sp. NBC_00249]|uniref:flavin reductase family protein n=1 Tax=Streptomyces sp. NBC_00249 TaxID=2975690 RepID=UPI00225A2557|nr:flavin reductase family protein [Streptomyces sp. NBC_00249]MCX5198720.1 flavin reductase family protein [Streptomyces sp. NBC_00249]
MARCAARGGRASVPDVPKPTLVPAPACPTPHPEGVSNDEFRDAMSRLAAGVCLITANEPPLSAGGGRGEDVGMTATAFMSVSLEPPLVLVSVREGSRMDDLLAEQPLWAVSVLADSQVQVASRFAMKNRISDRLLFEDVPYVRGAVSGAPLLTGALATLECRTQSRVEAGDHTLVIGHVLTATQPSPDTPPLTYFRGRYRHLTP